MRPYNPSGKNKRTLSPVLQAHKNSSVADIDREANRKYQEWKTFARQNSAHLQDVIERIESDDKIQSPPRSPLRASETAGSSRVRSPEMRRTRPKTANNTTDTFSRAIRGMHRDIELFKKESTFPWNNLLGTIDLSMEMH